MAFNDLISMKKSSKSPKEGDVFVLQPIKDIFYFGKVIQTNLESVDSFINGMTLIYIYQYWSDNRVIPYDLDQKGFLIAPMIVNTQPWKKGYFETIGNVEVSEIERNVDLAFWNVLKEEYVDINGKKIECIPEYCSIYGLGSYGIVGKEVQNAIKNESGFIADTSTCQKADKV